jgi:5-methylcytosine-specific restriction endonuclease McrA
MPEKWRHGGGSWRERYCSAYCSRLASKRAEFHKVKGTERRVRGSRMKREERLSIAYEYGYACQLCGILIDLSRPWPHPDSLSIDHIVPVAKGGGDERANLWPAHLRCNAARQDKEVEHDGRQAQ